MWLKSGGYIVINQTEALVAIDINTGKYVGKSNRLEDTIVKTNTDAVKEIVRQIRLRDLGGIIVVDFIDMDERKNRQKVMQALEEAMRADRAPYKILQFNDFGLVAITRKRVKQSLERTLCTPCPYCEGAGYVKSPQTVVGEILQEAHKCARRSIGKDVLLRVNPEVAKLLKSNQNSYPAGDRRDPRPHRDGQERSAAAPGEVRPGLNASFISRFCMIRPAAAIFAFASIAAAVVYPKPSGYVNDFAHRLPPEFASALESRLRSFEQSTGIEVAVVTVPSLEGERLETYATGLFNDWGIGKRGANNGVLFLWAPTERKVRIEVGRGLNQALTDPQAKQIAEDVTFHFRSSDFEGGVTTAVDEITTTLREPPAAASPETLPETPQHSHSGEYLIAAGLVAAVTLLIVFVIVTARRGKANELRKHLPGRLDQVRQRIQEGQTVRMNAAKPSLEALRGEAPPEVYNARAAILTDAVAAYSEYQRRAGTVGPLLTGNLGALTSAKRMLARLERDLGDTNWKVDSVAESLGSFRANRDWCLAALPALDQAVSAAQPSDLIAAARRTLDRVHSLVAVPLPNWFLIRDLMADAQNCIDHANGIRLGRPGQRSWDSDDIGSPAMAALFAANAFSSSSDSGSSSWGSDSGSFSGGDSGGSFGGGDSGGGGASGSY